MPDHGRDRKDRRRLPRVGLDAYSLTGPTGRELSEPDVFSLLRTAHELGAEGLQAPVPSDPAQVQEAFALAGDLGMYLEPYVLLPIHWEGDTREIARREEQLWTTCEVSAEHGVQALHCTMGARERFADTAKWKAHVDATAECLVRLSSGLRDHGIRIGIENHWDYSSYELAEIADRAGSDVAGAGLDTGNLLVLAEAPDEGIKRSAPITATTHLKDVYMISTPNGAARPIVPLGEGQIKLKEALRHFLRHNPDLNLTIEDHPGIFAVDYFEDWWLEAVPELTSRDVATAARLAREGDGWVSRHEVPDPRAEEVIPWAVRGPTRLAGDVAIVKRWVEELADEGEPFAGRGPEYGGATQAVEKERAAK